MATDVQDANLYDLHCGTDLSVHYTTSSFAGPPQFTVTENGTPRHFSGDEIQREEIGLGILVTVTLEVIPDLKTETFSVLVPHANIRDGQVKITGVAIWTTHRTSIGGPKLVDGALQVYRSKQCEGTADHVVF